MHFFEKTFSSIKQIAPLSVILMGIYNKKMMKKLTPLFLLISFALTLSNCMGIRHISIDTREPGRIEWSPNVLSVVVVNNVVQQPDDIGHDLLRLGYQSIERASASSDSIAIIYTEALAQFIDEEEHFQRVLFLHTPMRTDEDFLAENPLTLDQMREILRESRADAIISLDRLVIQTAKREILRQEKLLWGELITRIQSTVRIYKPTMEGILPAVIQSDSLSWNGFDRTKIMPHDADILPTREEAMKMIAVRAAERMTNALSPHWASQKRWFYTSLNARMREGVTFARGNQWDRANESWKAAFNSARRTDKAKAATNVALAYEMLDDLENALEWATLAHQLFEENTSPNSLERRRALLHKNELQRRLRNSTRLLDMSGF